MFAGWGLYDLYGTALSQMLNGWDLYDLCATPLAQRLIAANLGYTIDDVDHGVLDVYDSALAQHLITATKGSEGCRSRSVRCCTLRILHNI